MADIINICFFIFLIVLGYIVGSIVEANHYKSIKRREAELLHLPAVTLPYKQFFAQEKVEVERISLVSGSVVLSEDYFKRILGILTNFFGGKMTSYESLIDRARREAILRMKVAAKDADVILNVRLLGVPIGKEMSEKNSISSVEIMAYGTAIKILKPTA